MKQSKALLGNVGVQVVIAMILGTLVGAMMGEGAVVFAPLGVAFIHLIKMLVIPLVVVAIISGAAKLGDSPAAGKIGISTFAFFMITSALAVTLALVMGAMFQPGAGIDMAVFQDHLSNEYADRGALPGVAETFIGMIPTNFFQAMNDANILQIMTFCLFLGIALSKVDRETAKPFLNSVESLLQAFVWMINIVMRIAPIGVFGLMAESIGTYGFDMLTVVVKLFVVYVAAIAIYGFIFYPLMVRVLGNRSAIEFLSKMKKPQAVALSTASSMATLPVTMETVEEELKVSKSTAAFVLPLGATINMSGNAIYYGLVAIFFAQLFNIELSMAAYGAIVLTATIGAIGQAGVPGPSFLVVAVLLAAGIPIEGLPLLFALDRLFDMIRTALNITGDAACAVIVDRLNPVQDKLEELPEESEQKTA